MVDPNRKLTADETDVVLGLRLTHDDPRWFDVDAGLRDTRRRAKRE